MAKQELNNEKTKKKSTYNELGAIRGALRRSFSRSPVVREVLRKVRREVPKFNKDGSRAKKDAVQYLCGVCKEYTGSTKVTVDHITPVIPESGFTDWNTFISRLFCEAKNLQVICDPCHNEKTNKERTARQKIKDEQMYSLLSAHPSTLDPKELKLFKRLKKKLGK